jgi:hypothetical protein
MTETGGNGVSICSTAPAFQNKKSTQQWPRLLFVGDSLLCDKSAFPVIVADQSVRLFYDVKDDFFDNFLCSLKE